MLPNPTYRPAWLAVAALVAASVILVPTHADASDTGRAGDRNARGDQATVTDIRQPQNLPVGAPPAAAYLAFSNDHRSPIYRPGKPPLDVGSGQVVSDLMRAHGGYIVTINGCPGCGPQSVRFVADDGHRKILARVASSQYLRDAVASLHGGLVAITVSKGNHERVTVRRISNGHVVARHAFAQPVLVAAMSQTRALLTTRSDCRPCSHDLSTRWWNLHTGRMRVIDRTPRARPGDAGPSSPGDLSAAQVALVRGDHDRVVTLPQRPARAWRTRSHEWVLSWSPDDRYVLTAGELNEAGWGFVAVRRASTGTLVTRIKGAMPYENLWSPVWENASTITFMSGYDCGGECDHEVPVRCTVHGACEQMALPAEVGWVNERRPPLS